MTEIQSTTSRSSECEVDLGEDEYDEVSARYALVVNLTRTQSLVLDYKQFKAARSIQRYIRGWLVRRRKWMADLSAGIIQKWWKRYRAQRNLVYVAENRLQMTLRSHYERSATMIQKVFRGWWSRKHIFDLNKLKALQALLSEDILHYLSGYLHQTKRKSLLPGVYNVRLSRRCLELTEQLMSTFGYRFYNGHACYKMQKTMAKIADLRKAFAKSSVYTKVPFRGFNDRRVCERRLTSRESVERDVRSRDESFDLIQAFVEGQRNMNLKKNYTRVQSIAHFREEARVKEIAAQRRKKGFFKRIALEMKNWHYADGEHILPRELFSLKIEEMKTLLNCVEVYLEHRFGRLEPCVCGTLDMPSDLADT